MGIEPTALRIVFVVSNLGQTGPTRQLLNLSRYLIHDGVLVSIVTLSSDPHFSLKSCFVKLNIPVYCLDLGRLGGLLIGGFSLRKRLKLLEPDVIHTQGIRADVLSARLLRYSRRVSTQRNIPEHDYVPLYGRVYGTVLAWIHKYALRRIPTVVACSHAIAKTRTRGMASMTVINNGVDLEVPPPELMRKNRHQIRSKISCANGNIFLYAGPLIDRKNPTLLIRAFREWESNSRHCLLLVGEGPLLSECRRLALGAPNIFLPGHQDNMSDYFCAADVFLSASRSEGLPNGVLEALAYGLPLLLSDIPSHREIVKADYTVGQFFKTDSLEALIAAFSSYKSSEKVRRAARQLAESKFSAASMGQQYKKLYETLKPRLQSS